MPRLRWVNLMVLCLVLLAGCVAPPPPPQLPQSTATPQALPADDGGQGMTIMCRLATEMDGKGGWEGNAYYLGEGECFIANQVIASVNPVSGISMRDFFSDNGVEVEEVVPLDLGAEGFRAENGLWETWRVTLANMNAPELVARLDERYGGDDRPVVVDYNYVMGTADAACDTKGLPYSIGAHPYSIGAHPYSIGAHPVGTSARGTQPEAVFMQQWALATAPWGIGLYEQAGDGSVARTVGETGRETYVAVFDTAPVDPGTGGTWEEAVPVGDGTMPLTVIQAKDFQSVVTGDPNQPDIKDHGLFAASLVHTVAPDSTIHLVRVLNDVGLGDVFGLLSGIAEYVRVRGTGDLSTTVINMSLGVVAPCAVMDIAEMAKNIQVIDIAGQPIAIDGQAPIFALEQVMRLLSDQKAVLVAAAGNNSAQASQGLPPHLPAAYPFVLGVMASGQQGERACYSNEGWIAAPGGNPGDGKGGCDPSAVNACNGPDCGAGVIGTALQESSYAYYYWMGTSFAAPLVSGLCALTLEQGSDACRPGTSSKALACPSPEGLMVANVPVALAGATCPTP